MVSRGTIKAGKAESIAMVSRGTIKAGKGADMSDSIQKSKNLE